MKYFLFPFPQRCPLLIFSTGSFLLCSMLSFPLAPPSRSFSAVRHILGHPWPRGGVRGAPPWLGGGVRRRTMAAPAAAVPWGPRQAASSSSAPVRRLAPPSPARRRGGGARTRGGHGARRPLLFPPPSTYSDDWASTATSDGDVVQNRAGLSLRG